MEGIKVKSTVEHMVSVNVPAIHFARVWPSKGAEYTIPKETFDVLIYDPGFHNMVEEGTLYIEDMEVKKEYGLEPEDATEPVNIIVLSDDRKKYLMTVATAKGFREQVEKLPLSQIEDIAMYAVHNRYTDYEKCKILKELCGRDVELTIRLNEADQEG